MLRKFCPWDGKRGAESGVRSEYHKIGRNNIEVSGLWTCLTGALGVGSPGCGDWGTYSSPEPRPAGSSRGECAAKRWVDVGVR